jgi:hypothetical protein
VGQLELATEDAVEADVHNGGPMFTCDDDLGAVGIEPDYHGDEWLRERPLAHR